MDEMTLAKLVAQYQPAAVLIMFAFLLYWVLKQNAEREDRLMTFSQDLLAGITALKEELKTVGSCVAHLEEKVDRMEGRGGR